MTATESSPMTNPTFAQAGVFDSWLEIAAHTFGPTCGECERQLLRVRRTGRTQNQGVGHNKTLNCSLWTKRHRAGYCRFGPKNVGSLLGRSFECLSGGRRLMSRQSVGVRDSSLKSPGGGVFGIFGSTARLPGKIVMPQEMEGSGGENSGRVGSTGRCASSGDAGERQDHH